MGKDQAKKEKANDRAKIFKKAVLAGVGATSNVERVKAALSDAMEDLVKVGQDLLDELEDKGKGKTENFQHFLRNLQDEAGKRTHDAEKKVSSKLSGSTKKAAKEFGIATHEDLSEILERLHALEEAVHGPSEDESEDGDGETGTKKRGRKKANPNNN
ncbi:MAG: phasin family protein [Cyanobacteria bacterium SZAS-4]|nr:phasin family protein [Cyanobacteria bacterium SZAS-4]